MSGSRALVAAVLVGAALAAPTGAAAASPETYLLGAQNADGGLPAAPGGASSVFVSEWAAIGLVAAGRPCATVAGSGGATLADFVEAAAPAASGAGDVERTLLALGACKVAVPAVLLDRLAAHRRSDGSYDGRVNTTAFAVLALRAVGRARATTEVRGAARWLVSQQGRDGGFGFGGRRTASDADDTGAVLEALAAAGRARTSRPVRRAVAWLTRTRRPDGGYGLTPRSTSNAQSTAFAIQGLLAAGRTPRRSLSYLRTLVGSSGAVRYSRTSVQTPVWVTAQALAALSRRVLPVLG